MLTQIARSHNQDMLANDFVAHQGSNGFASADRALAAGYVPYGWGKAYVGENIAAGLHTPADAVRGWLNSPTHRANLLRPEYREIGVGCAKGGTYGTYWTQDFGSAPDVFPVFVNLGSPRVADPHVALTLTNETVSPWGSMGPAVSAMVSNDPSFRGAAWQTYTSELEWTLPPRRTEDRIRPPARCGRQNCHEPGAGGTAAGGRGKRPLLRNHRSHDGAVNGATKRSRLVVRGLPRRILAPFELGPSTL